jgi:hypothetical protein
MSSFESGQPGQEDRLPPTPPIVGVHPVGEDAVRVEFRIEDLVTQALARAGWGCAGCGGGCRSCSNS